VRRVPPSPGTASLADLRLLWGRLNLALPPHASARRLIIPHSQGTGVPAVRQRAATMSANHRLHARHIRFRVLTMNVAYVLIFGDAQQISRERFGEELRLIVPLVSGGSGSRSSLATRSGGWLQRSRSGPQPRRTRAIRFAGQAPSLGLQVIGGG